MKTIYKLNSTVFTETNNETIKSKRETFHTNLSKVKDILKDKLNDISFDDRKHTIWIDGNRKKIYKDETGCIIIEYRSIDRIKVDKYL